MDVITRFKLETTQYDSKLRDASKGLQNIVNVAQSAGKSFTGFSQKAVDAARALGTTASGATNAKEKVRDLVGSFNDTAKAYNKLTETQRQSDFGKELAASLTTLQGRIKEAKQELYGLGDAAGKVGDVHSIFGEGGLKGAMAVFGGNLMTKAAGYVASLGTEIVSVMNQSAELARSAEGVQLAFQRLGRGDLLDGLREATHGTVSDFELMKAAVKFNDFKLPLEELGTMLAFAQQKAKDTGQSVDYMVDSIVTGLGRKSLMILDNLGLSAAEVKDKMAETGDMTKAVGEIIREQMSKAGDYVETAADRATQANVDLENAMLDLGNAMRETFGYTGWSDMAAGIKTELVGALTFTIETINEAKQRFMELLQLIGLADKAPKPTPSAARPNGTYWESTDANGNVTASGRWLNGQQIQTGLGDVMVYGKAGGNKSGGRSGGSSGGRTSGGSKVSLPEIGDFDKQLAKSLTGSVDLKETADMLSPYQMMLSEIKKNILDIKDADLGGALAEAGNNEVVEEINAMTNAVKQQQMAFNLAGQAANSFGAALMGIDDPAAKAAGQVTQAIASIALGFAMASSQADTAGTGWGWLAWLAAGASAMATTIGTIHSLTGYATGGEVKGNSYSGDQIPIMANAGEVILNRAQQGNLASQLQEQGGGGGYVPSHISGEQIYIALNRYIRRSGRGEMVTWKN